MNGEKSRHTVISKALLRTRVKLEAISDKRYSLEHIFLGTVEDWYLADVSLLIIELKHLEVVTAGLTFDFDFVARQTSILVIIK